MIDVMSRLGEVKVKTAEALRASEADERASVVLVAVVREFDSKADKANRHADDDAEARDSVIEPICSSFMHLPFGQSESRLQPFPAVLSGNWPASPTWPRTPI